MTRAEESRLAIARRCQMLTQQYLAMLTDEEVPGRPVLEDAIARIVDLVRQQDHAQREAVAETRRQHVLASVLRGKHLNPIVRAVRQRTTSTIDLFTATDALTGNELVAEARRAAARVKPLQPDLVAAGFTPTFLSELLEVARALENSIARRMQHWRTSKESATEIRQQLRRARFAIEAIESVIRREHASTPHVLAAWRAARRRKRWDHEDAWPEPRQPSSPIAQEEEACAQ